MNLRNNLKVVLIKKYKAKIHLLNFEILMNLKVLCISRDQREYNKREFKLLGAFQRRFLKIKIKKFTISGLLQIVN
jgi:hypothetical protein